MEMIERILAKINDAPMTTAATSRAALARKYKADMLEGGEGYNPYAY
jgi:hypothetical protein